jgi:hypothetical protein
LGAMDEIKMDKDQSVIIRYFNLYSSGTYIMTEGKPLEADYVLPIKSDQRHGFLLQCYDSGHINKVFVSTLLARKINKEYMNGLNLNDQLSLLTIIDSEKILGLYFYENGKKKFKAHLTENISCRELLHLQGYKVIYNNYSKLEYKILPLELKGDIDRLVYQSFSANGKPLDNDYFEREWTVLKKFYQKDKILSNTVNNLAEEQKEQTPQVPLKKVITQYSTVKLKYINKDKEMTVHLVDYEASGFEGLTGIQKIYNKSPLAVSIIGKAIGDRARIGNTEHYVEIEEIL